MLQKLNSFQRAFLHQLRKHDKATYEHSLRVGEFMYQLGKYLGYEEKKKYDMFLSGVLHDVGKLKVPSYILTKEGTLTPSEWKYIKEHSLNGFKLLAEPKGGSYEVLMGILHHHENFDGTGYPFNLKDKDIHIYGRMIRIIDSFDAMYGYRPYSNPLTKDETMDRLREGNETLYDPVLLETILSFLSKSSTRSERLMFLLDG